MNDWDMWRQAPREALVRAQARALGMHIDPERSRTHVLIQEIDYSPRERDVRRKFAIVRAGVFRVREVLHGIEALFSLAEGHGEAWVQDLVETAEISIPPSLSGDRQVYYHVMTLSIERRTGSAAVHAGVCTEKWTG